MTRPLDHAAAHERLADLALEPGALDRLGDPTTDPLAAHLATCDACRRDVAAWRRTHARLDQATGGGVDRVDLADLAGDPPVAAPPALRGAVLEAVRASRATGVPATRADRTIVPMPATGGGVATRRLAVAPWRWPGDMTRRLLPLVAVLAIVAGGAGLLVDQAQRLDRARTEVARLEAVAASLDRVLNDPNHTSVDLRAADGSRAGTLAWSSRDLVVLTTALQPPPAGRVYRCWIERDGKRSPVGQMWFAGGTAFWNGTLDEWATTSFEAGGTFGVSLEPVGGSTGNPAVLVADLD
jgi:hypothetical protein